jgi:hypothetical protein
MHAIDTIMIAGIGHQAGHRLDFPPWTLLTCVGFDEPGLGGNAHLGVD